MSIAIIVMNHAKSYRRLESPHWRSSLKKVITSAYSKSSNSSGFNPILQKFYEMVCEIIVFKIVCGIFLFFCQLSFINNFMKNNFSEPQNYRKLNISRPIYFIKISAHRFEDPICKNKLDGCSLWKIFFSRTWSFFHDWKTTNKGVVFFYKKLILFFFQRWTYFRNLFRKTVKKWWFYSFK